MNIFTKILEDGTICVSQKNLKNKSISTIYLSLMQAKELSEYFKNGMLKEAEKQSYIFKESF